MKSRQEVTPIFVLGTARSGTTWLANLLVSHPQIAGVTAAEHHGIHESHLLDHTRYCFPERLSFREFLHRYREEDYFKLTGLDLDALTGQYDSEGDVVTFFRLVMDEFARSRGASFWLEKTPKHTLYYRELARRFPDAKFVVIEREFRDTLMSQLNKYPRPGASRWRQIAEKLFRYESDMRAIRRLRSQHPQRVVSIRYEDLVRDKNDEIRRITEQLALPYRELESRFAPASSYGDRPDGRFTIKRHEWPVIAGMRAVLKLVPFGLMVMLRRRRDLEMADVFPRYTLIGEAGERV